MRRGLLALNKLDGVDEAEVNLASAKATVRFDPASVDPAAFTARIEKLGYHVPEVVDFEAENAPQAPGPHGLALAPPAMTIPTWR
ncbi:MAG: heavy metal-associated domain-containing protein [Acidimicrobiales bacterium]